MSTVIWLVEINKYSIQVYENTFHLLAYKLENQLCHLSGISLMIWDRAANKYKHLTKQYNASHKKAYLARITYIYCLLSTFECHFNAESLCIYMFMGQVSDYYIKYRSQYVMFTLCNATFSSTIGKKKQTYILFNIHKTLKEELPFLFV